MKKLVAILILALPMAGHADLIDTGVELIGGTGGLCSTCGIDGIVTFDDLELDVDATLNAIDFDIVLYNLGVDGDLSGLTFGVQIWDPTHTTEFLTSEYLGSEALYSSWIAEEAYNIAFDLGDVFLNAGSYVIGLYALEDGAFSTDPSDYNNYGTSDTGFRQWNPSSSTFVGAYGTDLPYRLTYNTTSVPEPGTLALFGIGLLGMAATRRKKKA